MNIGTYKQCSDCKLKDNCCNSFKDSIDNVMLHEQEYFNIIKKINIKEPEKYFSKIDEKIYNIKTNENNYPKLKQKIDKEDYVVIKKIHFNDNYE